MKNSLPVVLLFGTGELWPIADRDDRGDSVTPPSIPSNYPTGPVWSALITA